MDVPQSVDDTEELLAAGKYVADRSLATAMFLALKLERPLFLEGEAGVGYMLPKGFDLPPLMFTKEEIEALVVGARMVEGWGDAALARQALPGYMPQM